MISFDLYRIVRICFITGALLLFLAGTHTYWFYTVEDAYISFRYCDHMLEGKGLVFNPGDRVEGYTNFLWILLMALPRSFLNFPFAAKITGLVMGLLLLSILIFTTVDKKSDKLSGALAAFIVAVCPGVQMWAVAGLETILFTLCLVTAIYFHEKNNSLGRFFCGVCFGLSTLTRPEGILFFTLFAITVFFIFRSHPQNWLEYLGGYALVFLPHIFFRYIYYQAWAPNTFWVKSHRFQGGGGAYFKRYAAMTGVVTVPIAYFGLFEKKVRKSILPSIVMGSGYLIYVYHIGGDWMPYGRFIVPVIPLFALAASRFWIHIEKGMVQVLLGIILIAGILVSVISAKYDLFRFRPTRYFEILTWENEHMKDWKLVGEWLNKSFPETTILSTGLAGIIPYHSKFTTIDRGGLNDKEIAQIIHQTRSEKEEKKIIDDIIISRKPDVVLIEELSFDMLRASPVLNEKYLPNNPAFLSQYTIKTSVVDERYFSYYVLKDSFLKE